MPKEAQPLFKPVRIGSATADIGSDWHNNLEHVPLKRVITAVRRGSRNEIVLILGDVFENSGTSGGVKDMSGPVSDVCNALADDGKQVYVVLGNHDLRMPKSAPRTVKMDPWRRFQLASNVTCPRGINPIDVEIGGKKILLANLFCDGTLYPQCVRDAYSLTPEGMAKFYRKKTDDGKGVLFKGLTDQFKDNTQVVRSMLHGGQYDGLATHYAPHYSAVMLPVEEKQVELRRQLEKLGIPVLVDGQQLEKLARKKFNGDVKKFIAWALKKRYWAGSDVLSDVDFGEEFSAYFGHLHGKSPESARVGEGTVYYINHQQVQHYSA